jgi:hypothetical protein
MAMLQHGVPIVIIGMLPFRHSCGGDHPPLSTTALEADEDPT